MTQTATNTLSAVLTLGDLLKSEADTGSREHIKSETGLKIGQLIKNPATDKYLVALSNEETGQVLVQPRNCTIFFDNVDKDDMKAKSVTIEQLVQEGVAVGIKFIGAGVPTAKAGLGSGASTSHSSSQV